MKNGYKIYDTKSAPKESQVILSQVQEHYQFIPNALGAMAESPNNVQAYMQLSELARQTGFSSLERHIIFLTISREYCNGYCVAAQTAFAQMDGVDDDIIQQLREGKPLADPKLRALQYFAQKLVQTGCNVTTEDVEAVIKHGYTRRNILEVVLLMTNKLIAVFCNRIMGTDLDEALQPARWVNVA